jgi:alpha-glucosidase
VQEALLDVVRFWLDRGVDGFRLDTINFYFHDKELRDNPPLAPGAAQRHHRAGGEPLQLAGSPLRQEPARKTSSSCKRFRALLDDEYPGTTRWARWAMRRYGLQIQAEYTSGDDKVHMCYAFEFLSGTRRRGRVAR